MNNVQQPQSAIMLFVLKGGLQVVGEATFNPTTDTYTVVKPFKEFTFAFPQPTPQGMGVAINTNLVPAWPMTGRTSFELHAGDLLFTPDVAPKGLQNEWIKMTSGIQVAQDAPKSNIILGA